MQLKNGDIIKGIITEHVFNDYIRIELAGGSIMTFKYVDIDRIEKEEIAIEKKPQFQNTYSDEITNQENIFENIPMETLVRGAIGGYTFYPRTKKFYFALNYYQREKNSFFDDEGEEQTYGEYWFDGDASPTFSYTSITTNVQYALLDRMKIMVFIPYHLSASLKYNPDQIYEDWFDENLPDLSGEIGIGDISIGTEYLMTMNENNRIALGIGYKFANGSAKDEISESSLYATGSGQTNIELSVASDFRLFQSSIFSFGTSYVINNEGEYSEDGSTYKEKPGNGIFYGGRISHQFYNNLACGISLTGGIKENKTVDGEEVEESEYNYMKLTPSLGYQFTSGESLINFVVGSQYYIKGTNYSNWKGFNIGFDILF